MADKIVHYNPATWIFEKIFSHSKLFSNLAKYFANLLIKRPPVNVQSILFGIGISAITYKLGVYLYKTCKFFNWIPAQIQNQLNYKPSLFKQKYGDCYVLITGAADGIGYAYCWEFAKMGFNIILTDIQERKLLSRKHELTQSFPKIRVECFVADMSDLNQIKRLIENIENFDIGIVVNNVGLIGGGKFLQVNPELMKKTLIVNYRPAYEINAAMIPKLRNRKQRSAIINTSSCTGFFISHNVGAYSSIKLATDIYSRTLSIQNRDKIDIISSRPFGVSTGMLKMKKSSQIITPRQCAVGVLIDLGNCDTTFSGVPHKFMASYFATLNQEQSLKTFDQAWAKNKKL